MIAELQTEATTLGLTIRTLHDDDQGPIYSVFADNELMFTTTSPEILSIWMNAWKRCREHVIKAMAAYDIQRRTDPESFGRAVEAAVGLVHSMRPAQGESNGKD